MSTGPHKERNMNMGWTVDDTGESNYVKKGEVGTGVIAKIVGTDFKNVAKQGAKPEEKGILIFEGNDLRGKPLKPLICNKTNATMLAMITGSEDSDNWIGTTIILWNNEDVSYTNNQGQIEFGGTRIKKLNADPGRQIPTTPVADDDPPVANEGDLAGVDEDIHFEGGIG